MTTLALWLGDPSWIALCLGALSLCGHVAGAVVLHRCRKEARERHELLAQRIDDLEGGTTHRQMLRYCDEMTARVTREQARTEQLLVKLREANDAIARTIAGGIP